MDKEIAFQPNTVTEENLPLSTVLYPGFYGTFFAFKSDAVEQPHFCSCSSVAIRNYIELRQLTSKSEFSAPDRMYILDSLHFPISVVRQLMNDGVTSRNVFSRLNFGDRLCHECNLKTPHLRYCSDMYGGAFVQNYGWYVSKQAYDWGVDPHYHVYLKERCPAEIVDAIRITPTIQFRMCFNNAKTKDPIGIEDSKALLKQNRKIKTFIENEVRTRFGHKLVGEAWTSETILFYILKGLYPDYTLLRHYRPKFLNGLELDVYVEELNLGVEYQGIQHYEPVEHWGGVPALKRLKERDKRKVELCREQGISVVHFKYDEELSEEHLRLRLSELVND